MSQATTPEVKRAIDAVIEADFAASLRRRTHYIVMDAAGNLRVGPSYMSDETVLEVCHPPAAIDAEEQQEQAAWH